jgi:FkbM family methyltransferase
MKLENKDVSHNKRYLINSFLYKKDTLKYILGTNSLAEMLSKLVSIDAFIDDFSDEKSFLGKPVITTKTANKNAIVISCSIAIYPKTAMNNLKKVGLKNCLHFLEISNFSDEYGLSMPFLDHARKDIELNFDKYQYLHQLMFDEESKRVFLNLLNFRKNHCLSYLSSYTVDFQGQYFEEFLDLGIGEVFVDVGGFDGETSLEFIRRCPDYTSIFIFEPSENNLAKAKYKLEGKRNIHFIAKGLSNKSSMLKFDSFAGSASSLTKNGREIILVDTLDNLVTEKVTFIKMDIEGAEGDAIEGMRNHILNDHPKLAISVYHKPDDLRSIPFQVLDIRNDYNLFIRHYTEGTDETVMFFIPAYK